MNDIEAAAVDDAFYKRWCSMAHLPNESQSDARRWFRAGAALAHAARGEGECDKCGGPTRATTFNGAACGYCQKCDLWVFPPTPTTKGSHPNGPVENCPCHLCRFAFDDTPPPATGDASNPGEKEER